MGGEGGKASTSKNILDLNDATQPTRSRKRNLDTPSVHDVSIAQLEGHASRLKAPRILSSCIEPGHPASFGYGAAIPLLISTAMTFGMTLGQLSNTLTKTPQLSQVLSTPVSPSAKLARCVRLFEIESLALLKRSMLLAGFQSEDTSEESEKHILVASLIHQGERQRLETMMNSKVSAKKVPMHKSSLKSTDASATGLRKYRSALKSSGPVSSTVKASRPEPTKRRRRPHMHRRGKCGHKAILHRPPGKPAHIDFIVGNVIECYEGIKPVGPCGEGAMWPSAFSCEEIACPEDSVTHTKVCGSDLCEADNREAMPGHRRPRQLSLSDIDFLGSEENTDFFLPHGDDDVLLGLLKLCEMESMPAVEQV